MTTNPLIPRKVFFGNPDKACGMVFSTFGLPHART
jgi:hypothetical protein